MLQDEGCKSEHVITSVNSSIFSGLMSMIPGNREYQELQFTVAQPRTSIQHNHTNTQTTKHKNTHYLFEL
jgi:hypothetical protein